MAMSLVTALAGLAAALPRQRRVAAAPAAPVAKRARPVQDEPFAPYPDASYEPFRDYRPGWMSGR